MGLVVSYTASLSSGGAFAQAISKMSIGFFFQGHPPRGGFGLISSVSITTKVATNTLEIRDDNLHRKQYCEAVNSAHSLLERSPSPS
ncbi:Hypothetical protein DIP1645 [Corynebacterium diphtheriae]|uniref:Uncharacterized protein n=1 Tax=Corynebacterium diphtheriae (strain ATCC 700971 / NCTC 13129 / Biotype gravis) TaxID=257309 RepID=Q6NG83_CORDI|nr:Hypothetical protein DIP1645 [Corynebacterium diphtheriae]